MGKPLKDSFLFPPIHPDATRPRKGGGKEEREKFHFIAQAVFAHDSLWEGIFHFRMADLPFKPVS